MAVVKFVTKFSNIKAFLKKYDKPSLGKDEVADCCDGGDGVCADQLWRRGRRGGGDV